MILIEFDKAGAEWVVVAYLTGDANMLSVVESGKSPHVVTGSLISRVPEWLVEKENEAVGHTTDPQAIKSIREGIEELERGDYFLPRSMSIRQCGKKSNHGLNYDERYKRFALENEIEEAESKIIVNLYKTEAYPGIPIWHETIQNTLRDGRTLTNCFGRKRVFMDAWGPELFNAAYAFIPQSTVYDITREAIVQIRNTDDKFLQQAQLLAQVHDQLLYQYPLEDPIRLANVIMRVVEGPMNPMMSYNGRDFRIGTTVRIGRNWSDAGMHNIRVSGNIDETEKDIEEALEKINGRQAA